MGREIIANSTAGPPSRAFLADDYTLQTEWTPSRTARWWTREETPASYRIYVLRLLSAALSIPCG